MIKAHGRVVENKIYSKQCIVQFRFFEIILETLQEQNSGAVEHRAEQKNGNIRGRELGKEILSLQPPPPMKIISNKTEEQIKINRTNKATAKKITKQTEMP